MGCGLHWHRLVGFRFASASVGLGCGLHRGRLVWASACTGIGLGSGLHSAVGSGLRLHRHRLVRTPVYIVSVFCCFGFGRNSSGFGSGIGRASNTRTKIGRRKESQQKYQRKVKEHRTANTGTTASQHQANAEPTPSQSWANTGRTPEEHQMKIERKAARKQRRAEGTPKEI